MPTITLDGRTVELEAGENLLSGLERHEIELPSSCRSGVCQSCLVKAVAGAVPDAAQKGLRDTQRAQGYLLACSCAVTDDLTLERVGDAGRYPTTVRAVRTLTERTLELQLEVPEDFQYYPGQFLNLVRPDGVVRSYSIASVPSLDDALHLHIALMPGGQMSGWVRDAARPGAAIELLGPLGNCFYTGGVPEQPMLLFGTGTGLAPLYGILRDALAQGHSGPIDLFHGSPVDEGLYLHDTLVALSECHPNFRYHACTLQAAVRPGVTQGDLIETALSRCGSLKGYRVYLCGNPEIVRAMQRKAFLAGANMRDIFADAFLPAAAR